MSSRFGSVSVESHGDVGWIWLERSARHNSLTPALVAELAEAAGGLACSDLVAVVLSGRGPSFSTGGDIDAFLAESDDPATLRAYAETVVGGLNEAILALSDLPMPLIARVNGPLTGGALGLALAADMTVMAEDAFIQPYYGTVGFAPDGGWTAMLPDRVGVSRAIALQCLNRRITAAEALEWGLADAVVPRADLDARIADWVASIDRMDPETLRESKRLIRNTAWRGRLIEGLRAEKAAFVKLIGREAAIGQMSAFVQSMRTKRANG